MQVQRPHLELYLRWMEQQELAPATIGRRFGTVAGFFKYAVLDGHLHDNSALAVTRPRVSWEAQRRAVLHPLEYAGLLTAARQDGPPSNALLALLGMLGLRVSEACRVNVTDLSYHGGYELLQILGKATSRPPSRCPSQSCAPCTTPSVTARAGRSGSTPADGGCPPPQRPLTCTGSPGRSGSTTPSARTACGAPSAPPD